MNRIKFNLYITPNPINPESRSTKHLQLKKKNTGSYALMHYKKKNHRFSILSNRFTQFESLLNEKYRIF
jgi:hypothetical protein